MTPGCLDKPFRKSFEKILGNYETGIRRDNLNKALQQAEEVKDIAAKNLTKMAENTHETEKLLMTSQEMSMLAKDFSKNATEMEKVQKNYAFWLCSRKCLLMFAAVALVVLILYMVISFSVCGNMNLFGGC